MTPRFVLLPDLVLNPLRIHNLKKICGSFQNLLASQAVFCFDLEGKKQLAQMESHGKTLPYRLFCFGARYAISGILPWGISFTGAVRFCAADRPNSNNLPRRSRFKKDLGGTAVYMDLF